VTELTEMVGRVKEECMDAYFCGHNEGFVPFGCTPEESSVLFWAYSPYALRGMFSPKPMNLFRGDARLLIEEYGKNRLLFFHYKVSRIRRAIRGKNKSNIDSFVERNVGGGFSKEGFLSRCEDKFGKKINCLYAVYTGGGSPPSDIGRIDTNLPLLVGSREFMQEATDYLKQSPQDAAGFIISLRVNPDNSRLPDDQWLRQYFDSGLQKVDIFDFCKRPREVHYQLK